MTTLYRRRIARLQKLVHKQGLGSLLVTNPVNWFYLTGFTGEAGMLLVMTRRYRIEAHVTRNADGSDAGVKMPARDYLLTFGLHADEVT